MKIQFILALLIGPVLGVFLFYKILKANNILPSSFQELKKRWTVEGETVHTWRTSPPLWHRLLVLLAVIVLVAATIFIVVHEEIDRMWFNWCVVLGLILMVGLNGLMPSIYRVTDRGIWLRIVPLFSRSRELSSTSSPESKASGKEERLILWEEVDSVNIEKNKLIFNCQVPEPTTQKSLKLPSWMIRNVRRIAIRFSEEDTKVLDLIKEYADKNKFQLNLKSVS